MIGWRGWREREREQTYIYIDTFEAGCAEVFARIRIPASSAIIYVPERSLAACMYLLPFGKEVNTHTMPFSLFLSPFFFCIYALPTSPHSTLPRRFLSALRCSVVLTSLRPYALRKYFLTCTG